MLTIVQSNCKNRHLGCIFQVKMNTGIKLGTVYDLFLFWISPAKLYDIVTLCMKVT